MDEYVKAVAIALATRYIAYFHEHGILGADSDKMVEILDQWVRDFNLNIISRPGHRPTMEEYNFLDTVSPEDRLAIEGELNSILDAPDGVPDNPFSKLIDRIDEYPDPLIADKP